MFVVPSGRSAQIIVTTYRKNTQQGHVSTSAYKEATSIRNNLLSVLIPKIKIFCKKKMGCYQWQPSKSIITHAKSITYNCFQSRKQPNDKS